MYYSVYYINKDCFHELLFLTHTGSYAKPKHATRPRWPYKNEIERNKRPAKLEGWAGGRSGNGEGNKKSDILDNPCDLYPQHTSTQAPRCVCQRKTTLNVKNDKNFENRIQIVIFLIKLFKCIYLQA